MRYTKGGLIPHCNFLQATFGWTNQYIYTFFVNIYVHIIKTRKFRNKYLHIMQTFGPIRVLNPIPHSSRIRYHWATQAIVCTIMYSIDKFHPYSTNNLTYYPIIRPWKIEPANSSLAVRMSNHWTNRSIIIIYRTKHSHQFENSFLSSVETFKCNTKISDSSPNLSVCKFKHAYKWTKQASSVSGATWHSRWRTGRRRVNRESGIKLRGYNGIQWNYVGLDITMN